MHFCHVDSCIYTLQIDEIVMNIHPWIIPPSKGHKIERIQVQFDIGTFVDLTSRKSNLSEKLLLGLAKMMPQLILQDIMILLKGKKTHDGKIFHSSTLLEKNSDSIQNMPLNARDSSLTTHYSRYETLTRNNGKFNTLKEGEYLLCSKFLIFMFSLECVQELHNRKRSFSHGICSSKV